MSTDNPIKSYYWQISKAAISFLSIIIYSQFLGAEGRGELSVWLLVLQVVLMFNEWVMGSAMANWFSQFGFSTVLKKIWFFPIIVLALSYLFSLIFQIPLTIFINLALIGIGITVQNVFANYFQSTGEVLKRNKWQFTYESLKVVLLSIFLLLILKGFINRYNDGVELTLMIISNSAILWVIGALFLFSQRANKEKVVQSKFPRIALVLREGFWAQFGHLLLFILFKSPIYFAAKLSGDALAGIIANTLLIADAVWIFANTFGMVLHSRALENQDLRYHQKLASRYVVISFWGSVTLASFVLLIPQFAYEWVFGEEFGSMKQLWRLIFPGVVAMSFSAVLGNLLHAQNRFIELAKNHFLALLIMLVSFYFMKIMGVSVKHTLLYSFDFGVFLLVVFNVLSLKIPLFNKRFWKDNTLIMLRLLKKRLK